MRLCTLPVGSVSPPVYGGCVLTYAIISRTPFSGTASLPFARVFFTNDAFKLETASSPSHPCVTDKQALPLTPPAVLSRDTACKESA